MKLSMNVCCPVDQETCAVLAKVADFSGFWQQCAKSTKGMAHCSVAVMVLLAMTYISEMTSAPDKRHTRSFVNRSWRAGQVLELRNFGVR